jgi:glycosyltransferase involved in cell wall biosynthesis
MKIFEINTVCGSGSTGRIAANLARMLEDRGDECCIAYARGSAPSDVNAWQFGSGFSICLHGVMTRLTDRHALYSSAATRKLIQKIRSENPDIIHLHNIHGYYLNMELLFTFLKDYHRPVVWTLHDCWSYTGHCAHYSYAGCGKWQTSCGKCPQKKEYPASLLLDHSRQNFACKKRLFTSLDCLWLVTPSEWLKKEVEKSFFQNTKVTAIPNGIDTNVFVPTASDIKKRYGLEHKKVILGVASIWNEKKGLGSFYRLQKRLPEEYRIVLIGLNQKQLQKLPEGILGIERTENITELIQWYSAAEVYFNASMEETMGLTTGEAICCGTPVVVYRATAVPESVGDACGMVVAPNQIDEVAAAIHQISENREYYQKGCLAYRMNFQEEKANEAYYDIYRSLYGAHGTETGT